MIFAPAGVQKNREIKRKMCRFWAYLRLISLCNMLISSILYAIPQISRLDTAYFSTPVILRLNAARCTSTIDGDIRNAVMLKAQLIHRCALHHPPCVGATDIWHSGVPLTFAEITKLWIEPITLGTVKKTRKNGKHTGANAQFGRKVRKSREIND